MSGESHPNARAYWQFLSQRQYRSIDEWVLGLLQEPRNIHPFSGSSQPTIDGQVSLARSKSVTALRVDVEFGWKILALVF
jgi:hypothetical protein